MKKHYQLLISILLFLSIGAFSPIGCNTTISGTVSSVGDIPLYGVKVSIDAEGIDYTTTDSSGTYTFDDVPYGEYTITANYYYYPPAEQPIDIDYFNNGLFGKEIEANIQLIMDLCVQIEEIYCQQDFMPGSPSDLYVELQIQYTSTSTTTINGIKVSSVEVYTEDNILIETIDFSSSSEFSLGIGETVQKSPYYSSTPIFSSDLTGMYAKVTILYNNESIVVRYDNFVVYDTY